MRSHLRKPKRKSNTITLQPGDTLGFGQRASASIKLQALRVRLADKRKLTGTARICYGAAPNDRYSQRNEPQNISEQYRQSAWRQRGAGHQRFVLRPDHRLE